MSDPYLAATAQTMQFNFVSKGHEETRGFIATCSYREDHNYTRIVGLLWPCGRKGLQEAQVLVHKTWTETGKCCRNHNTRTGEGHRDRKTKTRVVHGEYNTRIGQGNKFNLLNKDHIKRNSGDHRDCNTRDGEGHTDHNTRTTATETMSI